jgi:hypothetical protein
VLGKETREREQTGTLAAALVTLVLPVLPHSLLAFSLVGLAVGVPPQCPDGAPAEGGRARTARNGLGVFYTVFNEAWR